MQVFIEPKGTHLIAEGKWKEDFLLEIEDKLSQLRTPVKDKYIGIIKKHLVDFDEAMARSRMYAPFEHAAREHVCSLLAQAGEA